MPLPGTLLASGASEQSFFSLLREGLSMEQWSSRLGFLLAAIGAAVGLGNVWRFPAVVGSNGGGAYLVPYLIAAFTLAVPLMIMEISVGRSLRADVVTACRQVDERFEVIGWLVGGSVLAVLSYYLVIAGWVLAFLAGTATGSATTFEGLTSTYRPLAFFLVTTLVVGAIVSLGVTSGIERMAKLLVPLVFVILVGMLVYVATLPGFSDGVRFFLTPDLSVLTDPLLWSAAFGQVFFSFSVGMGVLLTYGSYLGAHESVPRASVMIAVADLAVAMLAGLVIFGIVFSFGLEPTMGTELAFVTLPAAFEAMPFGTAVGLLFFGLLFVAAIAPSVSMLEVGVAAALRTTDWSRRTASVVVTGLILLAGLPSALSYSAFELAVLGRPFLDVIDSTVGTLGLPLSAIALVAIFAWYQPTATVREQLGTSIVVPLVKYVVPTVLLVVMALRFLRGVGTIAWRRTPDLAVVAAGYSVVALTGIALLVAAIGVAVRRRRRRRTA